MFPENFRKSITKKKYLENLEKYKELCKLGLTNQEMAKELGVNRHTITSYRKKTGVTSVNVTRRERLEKFKKMYLKGVPLDDIAAMLNVARLTLEIYMQELCLPKNSKDIPCIKQDFFSPSYIKTLETAAEITAEHKEKK